MFGLSQNRELNEAHKWKADLMVGPKATKNIFPETIMKYRDDLDNFKEQNQMLIEKLGEMEVKIEELTRGFTALTNENTRLSEENSRLVEHYNMIVSAMSGSEEEKVDDSVSVYSKIDNISNSRSDHKPNYEIRLEPYYSNTANSSSGILSMVESTPRLTFSLYIPKRITDDVIYPFGDLTVDQISDYIDAKSNNKITLSINSAERTFRLINRDDKYIIDVSNIMGVLNIECDYRFGL